MDSYLSTHFDVNVNFQKSKQQEFRKSLEQFTSHLKEVEHFEIYAPMGFHVKANDANRLDIQQLKFKKSCEIQCKFRDNCDRDDGWPNFDFMSSALIVKRS